MIGVMILGMNYKDIAVLITGGTGSFGNYFVNHLLSKDTFRKIIIYSRDEFKQNNMYKKLCLKYGSDKVDEQVRFFIGDVRDRDRLCRAFNGVDYAIHAAAMKQVPACEYNPFEAIKTNINGAQNVIDAALDRGVKRVVALSTDKAVSPINLYGGTKLVSDKLFVSANAYSGFAGTRFSVVRYGNVAGSRGSVIPYFRELLERGQNILPITDKRMTRFWMTLEDAGALVLRALDESKGGEVYVHKNPSFKVIDLAEAMNPDGKIEEVGIREGEKIHESMITKDDARTTFEYDNHYIIYPQLSWWSYKEIKRNGMPVGHEWEYSSERNDIWLSIANLKERLNNLDDEIDYEYSKLSI